MVTASRELACERPDRGRVQRTPRVQCGHASLQWWSSKLKRGPTGRRASSAPPVRLARVEPRAAPPAPPQRGDDVVDLLELGARVTVEAGVQRETLQVVLAMIPPLFVGSDDHAQAAGNLFTLIVSARLHKLDPEAYLCDLFRVLPQWSRDRYLELAPKYWLATHARIDAAQLAVEIGWLTIPLPPVK